MDTATQPPAITRTEHDSFGPIEVPADRLWGAQTQRSLQNFDIAGDRMPRELSCGRSVLMRRLQRSSARRRWPMAGWANCRPSA